MSIGNRLNLILVLCLLLAVLVPKDTSLTAVVLGELLLLAGLAVIVADATVRSLKKEK